MKAASLVPACMAALIAIGAGAANITEERAIAADQEPESWLLHGGNYAEQRYSRLNQINASNVKQLGLAWIFETDLVRGHEASPVVVDGVMYLTGPWSRVFAVDATSGKLIWRYNPQVPGKKGYDACCDVVNRGVAVWKGKVFVGTIDGRLIALDANTGKVVWDVLTIDPDRPYTITGAPRVVRDKVIIGNGGAELGVRGYITAYDTDTGKQLWRFFSVPGDPSKPFESEAMAVAAKTWKGGKWWEIGGGGTLWDSMAYDPQADLLYVGTGNGSPWNRWLRSPGGGDNLFLSSILALDPDTGELKWYFQTTPGDTWDFTATQHMILANLVIEGKEREVIMQAPKNGFFYVLDRLSGQFISGEAYVPVTWAEGLDRNGRPIEREDRLFRDAPRRVTPTPTGAHNWEPMSFSPQTGLVYIPAKTLSSVYAQDTAFRYNEVKKDAWGIKMGVRDDTPEAEQEGPPPQFFLSAWDPVAQKERWRADNTAAVGGVLSTAGNLVFAGNGDGMFNAYRADNGELLWSFFTERGILAPPVSFAIQGQQFIALLTGWGGASGLRSGSANPAVNNRESGRLLVFALDRNEALPESFVFDHEPVPLPALTASPATIAEGEALFRDYCMRCHSFAGGGAISDLINMSESSHLGFEQIVHDGAFESAGMIGFADMLSREQVRAIHQYIISSALEARLSTGEQPKP